VSTRYERRKKRREVSQKLKDPRVRKILADEIRRGGGGTETYTISNHETGERTYFNISLMREWAQANLPIVPTPPNFEIATRLVNDGTVDADHIAEHTIHTKADPIIICRDVFGGDQVVDGSHRFVAFCLGHAMFDLEDAYFPAYVLQAHLWQPFVIPDAVVRACGFHISYEGWLEEKEGVTE
jgi:hypothetical protein